MTKRVIEHEIKLQKSVIVILAVLAIGVCANAFAPAFEIKNALAFNHPSPPPLPAWMSPTTGDGRTPGSPFYVDCVRGCK